MKCILPLVSVLSVAIVAVVAIPASFHYGGGGGYNINGTGQSFNFSGDSNGTVPFPDFGRFLPNLTQPSGGFGLPPFNLPSSWANFTDSISSIFPGLGGGFFGNGQGGGGGGFPFFG
ncbi:ATP-dependent RNA helicase A-like [Anopheles stephensi]|uniref:Putative salivary protein SG2B n=1 Tax=Anopheles stephensi TaxID=30069 RepID=Q8I6Q4_ANOST|nr:ATP-dependent RNA helicase A-like [Anopheles stephensi]AAO06827.1 putative salivary protein SG2B [Anopheles stephensi]